MSSAIGHRTRTGFGAPFLAGILGGFFALNLVLPGLFAQVPPVEQTKSAAPTNRVERSSLAGTLSEQLTNKALPDQPRIKAAQRLILLKDEPATVQTVLQQITLLTPPNLSTELVKALGQSRHPQTGQAVVGYWWYLTPLPRRTGITTLLRRPEWVGALLEAVEKGDITKTELKPEEWQQLKTHPDPALAQRARKLADAGKPPISSAEREEVVKKLLPLLKEKGDIAHGKEVFKANCLVCHTFDGDGAKVGPDLTGIGSRERADILIDILDPNRLVEAEYRLWNVTTKDGDTVCGRLEMETQTTVEILDLTNQKHTIPRTDITSMEASALSIMPVGFEALPPEDLKGLIEYITQMPATNGVPLK